MLCVSESCHSKCVFVFKTDHPYPLLELRLIAEQMCKEIEGGERYGSIFYREPLHPTIDCALCTRVNKFSIKKLTIECMKCPTLHTFSMHTLPKLFILYYKCNTVMHKYANWDAPNNQNQKHTT